MTEIASERQLVIEFANNDGVEPMMNKKVLLRVSVLVGLTMALTVHGARAVAEEDMTMNGYSYEEFKGFEKNWHFVTVRYRGDTSEMRFIYANDLAYKALLKGSSEYPEGSRFGKISIQTQPDLDFPSSRVPSGKVRHTFMVRDVARHKDTYGWGYSLFDPSGKPSSGDHRAEARACAACHQIAKDAGQVFAKPMAFGLNVDLAKNWLKHLTFAKTSLKKVPAVLAQKIPSTFKFIHLIEGPLRKSLFSGTLDEIRPALFEEIKSTGQPAGLLSEDNKLFSIAYPVELAKCPDKKGAKAVHTLPNSAEGFYEIEVCLRDI
jgi:Cytochrome P460